jgi:hypothetical protein
MTPPNTLTDQERAAGWRLLFDGTTFTGWRGYRLPAGQVPECWRIQDGALHVLGIENRGRGDLMTMDTFGDFELLVDWTCPPLGNSGIMYRVTEDEKDSFMTGPEYQILDDEGYTRQARAEGGRHLDVHHTAGCYGLYAPPADQVVPVDTWNRARIVIRGNEIEHYFNGQLAVRCQMNSDDWKSRVAGTKFAAWTRFAQAARGHIVLQDHGHHHQFRNIKIREL